MQPIHNSLPLRSPIREWLHCAKRYRNHAVLPSRAFFSKIIFLIFCRPWVSSSPIEPCLFPLRHFFLAPSHTGIFIFCMLPTQMSVTNFVYEPLRFFETTRTANGCLRVCVEDLFHYRKMAGSVHDYMNVFTSMPLFLYGDIGMVHPPRKVVLMLFFFCDDRN